MISTLNEKLDGVREWTLSNRLTINVDKTKLVLFSNKRISNYVHLLVMIGSEIVELIPWCTYLEINLDQKLTCIYNIIYITGKLTKGSGIHYKIIDNLPKRARLNCYYGCMHAYLTFNVLLWEGT